MMRRYSLYIMFAGVIIVLLCFFMPWVVIDMSAIGGKSVTKIIGIREATRGLNFTTLALIFTITILGICIYLSIKKTPRILRTIIIISCIVGAFSFFLSLNHIATELRPYITVTAGTNSARDPQTTLNFDKVFNLQYGVYGIFIGYVLTFIGACNIPTFDLFTTDSK
ncbi:MAG: hypothetical protein OXD54_03700 [Candidatus Poribacteria bacterium]|nr:hypothetical protein [Candidatus Poribacteria bacterium]